VADGTIREEADRLRIEGDRFRTISVSGRNAIATLVCRIAICDRLGQGTIDIGEGCLGSESNSEEALMASNSTSKRGFASMDLERQREIASKGGRSVPAEKRSFSQDRELASSAGRKGGQSTGTGRPGED
jgi:general stress protein YciG